MESGFKTSYLLSRQAFDGVIRIEGKLLHPTPWGYASDVGIVSGHDAEWRVRGSAGARGRGSGEPSGGWEGGARY